MIKPDMIVVSPNNLDFPPWRKLVKQKRNLFSKVLNVVHEANRGISFTESIQKFSPEIETIKLPAFRGCWRHNATNLLLQHCTSDWILFYEQDFLPLIDDFFEQTFEAAEKLNGIIGFNYNGQWKVNDRLHPAFLLMPKSFLTHTTKDFSPAHPMDCFGTFSNELLAAKVPYLSLYNIGLHEERDWYHWNGLCSNMSLVQSGGVPNYNKDKFKEYIQLSLNSGISMDPRFIELLNKCLGA